MLYKFKKFGRENHFSIFENFLEICCASPWTWKIENLPYIFQGTQNLMPSLRDTYRSYKNEIPRLSGLFVKFWKFAGNLDIDVI